MARNDETPEKVIRSVVLKLGHGSLGTSVVRDLLQCISQPKISAGINSRQDNRLSQIANHKTQRRARISQAVRSMQYHERIKQSIIPLDSSRNLAPAFSIDAGAVEQRVELEGGEADAAGML